MTFARTAGAKHHQHWVEGVHRVCEFGFLRGCIFKLVPERFKLAALFFGQEGKHLFSSSLLECVNFSSVFFRNPVIPSFDFDQIMDDKKLQDVTKICFLGRVICEDHCLQQGMPSVFGRILISFSTDKLVVSDDGF